MEDRMKMLMLGLLVASTGYSQVYLVQQYVSGCRNPHYNPDCKVEIVRTAPKGNTQLVTIIRAHDWDIETDTFKPITLRQILPGLKKEACKDEAAAIFIPPSVELDKKYSGENAITAHIFRTKNKLWKCD